MNCLASITVNLSPFFDQASHWIGELLPFLAVAVGLSIAIGLLAYVARMFLLIKSRRR